MAGARAIEQDVARLRTMFLYDPSSKSGLRWKLSARTRPRRAGGEAGHLTFWGRWSVNIDAAKLYAHRIVWIIANGTIPSGKTIHHIDGNPRNNLLSNLSVVDGSENFRAKMNLYKTNTSGFVGVSWNSRKSKWLCRAHRKGKTHCLGYFVSRKDAAIVYDRFAKKWSRDNGEVKPFLNEVLADA